MALESYWENGKQASHASFGVHTFIYIHICVQLTAHQWLATLTTPFPKMSASATAAIAERQTHSAAAIARSLRSPLTCLYCKRLRSMLLLVRITKFVHSYFLARMRAPKKWKVAHNSDRSEYPHHAPGKVIATAIATCHINKWQRSDSRTWQQLLLQQPNSHDGSNSNTNGSRRSDWVTICGMMTSCQTIYVGMCTGNR